MVLNAATSPNPPPLNLHPVRPDPPVTGTADILGRPLNVVVLKAGVRTPLVGHDFISGGVGGLKKLGATILDTARHRALPSWNMYTFFGVNLIEHNGNYFRINSGITVMSFLAITSRLMTSLLGRGGVPERLSFLEGGPRRKCSTTTALKHAAEKHQDPSPPVLFWGWGQRNFPSALSC